MDSPPMSPGSPPPQRTFEPERVIRLTVGGTLFLTTLGTLTLSEPDSMLAAMWANMGTRAPACYDPATDSYFLDRDPERFRVVLNYLRTLTPRLPADGAVTWEMLLDEARFFGMEKLERHVVEEIEGEKRAKAVGKGGATYYLLRLSRTNVRPGPDGPSSDFRVDGSDVCSCLLWDSPPAGAPFTPSVPSVTDMERLDYELANFLAGAGQQLNAELERLYRMGFRVCGFSPNKQVSYGGTLMFRKSI
ncbi:BTB/POZ protein [Hyaloraphidium curvatum]|nr:BTB/POZ protein [Hyaloraphidium curvatum]